MNLNYKLFFKYILFHTNQIFFKYLYKNKNNLNIYINDYNFYYLILHIKLSSLFYSSQLCEIFSYELPNNNKSINDSIIIFNFNLILIEQRFLIFVNLNTKNNLNKNSLIKSSILSITELFSNANWLERETSELHNIFFSNKKDLRNLMLSYGDTSAPMKKSFPSIGIKEIFYDSISDLLIQSPTSIQF